MPTPKTRKTLYLPQWLVDLLDAEADRVDGPGKIVSASTLHFLESAESERIDMITRFRAKDLIVAYSGGTDAN